MYIDFNVSPEDPSFQQRILNYSDTEVELVYRECARMLDKLDIIITTSYELTDRSIIKGGTCTAT